MAGDLFFWELQCEVCKNMQWLKNMLSKICVFWMG